MKWKIFSGILVLLCLSSVYCLCPSGWTGAKCDKDIDECNTTFPCQNNASCINLPGSYSCNCLAGYNGSNCELDVDECLSKPCQNHGTCINMVNAFDCQCPQHYSGPTCACGPCYNNATCQPASDKCKCQNGFRGIRCDILYVVNFGESAFLEMPAYELFSDEDLTFEFQTTVPDGLLLYQGGDVSKEHTDHVAIELVNGSLRLSFNTDSYTKTGKIGHGLNDGVFHTVRLKLRDRQPFQATLSVDATQSVTVPGTQEVSFAGPLYFGGVRDYIPQIRYNLISGKSYIGCIKNFYQNEVIVNFPVVLSRLRNVYLGCVRKNVCLGNKCQQGSSCVDLWLNYTCRCKSGFSGPYCEEQTSAFFTSSAHSAAVFPSLFPIASFSFNFSVKTGSGGGILVYSEEMNPGQFGVAIERDRLKIVYGKSFVWQTKRLGGNMADGSWHYFRVTLANNQIAVSVDGNTMSIIAPSIKHLGHKLYFGTIPSSFLDLSLQLSGTTFTGCVRDVLVNDSAVQLDNGQRVSTSPLPRPGCLQGSSCKVNVCQNGGRCQSTWGGVTCQCSASYRGDRCQNGTALTFNSNTSSLLLTLNSSFWSFTRSGSLKFRTREDNGVLLYAGWYPGQLARQDFLKLEIKNRKVQLTANLGSGDGVVAVNRVVTENRWHFIEWSRKRQNLVLSLDENEHAQSSTPGSEAVLNIEHNGKILVNISSPVPSTRYQGCLKDLVFDTRPVNYLESQPGLTLHSVDIQTGCHIKNPCDTYPCKNRALCIDDTGGPRCLCPKNFTGVFCAKCAKGLTGVYCEKRIDQCASRPCMNNASCVFDPLLPVQNYSCLCLAGYTGLVCETEVDECLSNPCRNGTCVDQLNGYQCLCLNGFSGQTCENEINECFSAPCLNGALCEDLVGDYSCSCTIGYKGRNCETEIDECVVLSPCKNGARCIDGVGNYSCNCTIGYKGRNCETEIDECVVLSPCQNGAKCIDGVGNYSCNCTIGYKGRNCETEIDECVVLSPCQNGARCIDGVGNYSCSCTIGYTGRNCETEIDECVVLSPCQNGARCIDGVGNYSCNCTMGYTGRNCETEIDECVVLSPCQNGARCVDGVGNYSCNCTMGYKGRNCETEIDECVVLSPCQNGARCIDGVGNYSCRCTMGYKGRNCETEIDECVVLSPCQNGARCIDGVGKYSCNCTMGYKGRNCEREIDECVVLSPCQNGARCIDSVGSYSCRCTIGYKGRNCETEIDECVVLSPCQNGARCIDGVGNYSCNCTIGYEGRNCETEIDECVVLSPCQNGARCIDGVGNYSCSCTIGYTGRNCETEIDECVVLSPCQNGARCIDGVGNYSCNCTMGYKGRNCETEIDECVVLSPCQNGARCIDSVGSYSCRCTIGYKGRNCETDINECETLPCRNNANCTDLIGNYICHCVMGYSGRNCENELNECLSHPCKNGGSCTDKVADYTCDCPQGFAGRQCEEDVDECSSNPCLNNGICVDGINNYVCNCTSTGYRGLTCQQDINECLTGTHECKNGTCVNLRGDYICECFKFYEGRLCDNNTAGPTGKSRGKSSGSDEVFPWKYWIIILFGALISLVCTLLIFYYLRWQWQKTEGVYLPEEEEIRMAKMMAVFGLKNEESLI